MPLISGEWRNMSEPDISEIRTPERSGFSLNFRNMYNPDVLSCLANLSNDEVFTPPEIADMMLDLLPADIWKSETVTFLDPSCKSGVFLREIAKRLLEAQMPGYSEKTAVIGRKVRENIPLTSSESEYRKILQEKIDHIFQKQLYGIAITELTGNLSRRSLYCSRKADSIYSVSKFDNEDGNIRFGTIQHTWENGKCVFCGASQSEYDRDAALETHAYELIHTKNPGDIFKMKFDVIIGNPPYQLSDGGAQASAIPIYQKFVEQAKKMKPTYLVMIIPARWYSGGKGLDDFRDAMIHDEHIRVLHDFVDARECFKGPEIKGGVCYFLWNRDSPGLCSVYTHEHGKIISKMDRFLLETGCDIFIRYNNSIEILRKIQSFCEQSFSDIVRPAMTFGFRTFFKDFDSLTPEAEMVKVYANHSQGYIKKDKVVRGSEYIDSWKVYVPEAIGIGNMRKDLIKPILGEPNSISTETYVMNGPYASKEEAENAISYINTKFFHFLLGLKKITQHTSAKFYELIPMQDFSKPWTDEELYKKYGLSSEEIDFIESMVRPMDISGGDE